jgi:pimeloyl-ACP methyl ester carboxylesterase
MAVCLVVTGSPSIHVLAVPGVHLHYEVRGDGPLLLLLGAPMPAADFTPLAEVLARDHTVVTTDPRGIANSALDDPQQDSTPQLRADDFVRWRGDRAGTGVCAPDAGTHPDRP